MNIYNILNQVSRERLQDSDSDSTSSSESSESIDSLYESDEDNTFYGSAFESDDEDDSVEITNGKYYLGSYKNMDDEILIIGTRVGVRWFYNNELYDINNYLYWYSGFELNDNRLQIIQCFKKRYNLLLSQYTNDDSDTVEIMNVQSAIVYVCILKTHWIRLIQRTWKSVFKQRRKLLKILNLHMINVLNHRERHYSGIKIPELKGMLYNLVLQKEGLYYNPKRRLF